MLIKILILLSILTFVALADFTLGAGSEETRTVIHSRNRDLKAEGDEETIRYNGTIYPSNVDRNGTIIRDVYDPEWHWNSVFVATSWESGSGGNGYFSDDNTQMNLWEYTWILPANVSLLCEISVVVVNQGSVNSTREF
ncbi:hypothetical protein C0J52_17671 [Blattella germanica]|nr:hypothetical protein C0J52_17671 [Blattella germanica]